jgi:hypothetical protein
MLPALLVAGQCSRSDRWRPPPTANEPPLAPPSAPPLSGAPLVVAAAGDIAGRVNRQQQTAGLLLRVAGRERLAAILPLGDLVYPRGEYHDFLAYYHPSWGQPTLRALTRPVPGNHEYDQGRSDARGYFDYWNGPGTPAPPDSAGSATTATTSATGTSSRSTPAMVAGRSPARPGRRCTAGWRAI